jgi:hypothetical protein
LTLEHLPQRLFLLCTPALPLWTALYPGKTSPALAVRFDAMRKIRLPGGEGEHLVEVEPG